VPRYPIPNADIRQSGVAAKAEMETVDDLLKWVLGGLTNCRAEQKNLNSPWVTEVPKGWFYVYCVRVGTFQLMQHGFAEPLNVNAGDTVILPRCHQHRLRDSNATNWSDASRVCWFDEAPDGVTVRVEGSNRRPVTSLLVCRFRKPVRESSLLLDALPEYLLFRRTGTKNAESSESLILALLQEITQFPASESIVEHLVKALVLQTTRRRADQTCDQQNTRKNLWKDRVISKALTLMHSRPEFSWTVASLATAVGVSRSTFAARFVDQVGITPLSYLRQERMRKAAELLCDESCGIKEIAFLVGYESESAFNNAFKQWSGMTPGQFRSDRGRLV
jgi:AraC-like DNA-binding protein